MSYERYLASRRFRAIASPGAAERDREADPPGGGPDAQRRPYPDRDLRALRQTAELPRPGWLPEGWEGSTNMSAPPGCGPICPGCQYVWHPHCTSLVDVETGERVDPAVDWAAMPRDEWDLSRLTRCEHIDLTVAVLVIETDGQIEWRCPDCGGTTFEWVHRDHPPSGLRPGGFRAELDED